jgi:hypothetical protein
MAGSYRASIGHNPLIRVKKQSVGMVGQDVGIFIGAPSSGYVFPAGTAPSAGTALTAVATFHNISLYWSETSGSESNQALVRFKPVSSGVWRQGLSLWYDSRTLNTTSGQQEPGTPGTVPFNERQYRGSLVGLQPDTLYDVEVMTQASGNRRLSTNQIRTWSETFPVGTTVTVAASSSATLNITTGGSAGAYRLYVAGSGGSVIDGNFGIANGVTINANYVIVRGLTIREVTDNGIFISPGVHDVVIENNSISNFGNGTGDGNAGESHGIGTNTGLWPQNSGVTRIVIQNNTVSVPRYDTIRWPTHPTGSDGIFLKDTGGNNVVRYNSVIGTLAKMFSDGIAGGQDFSPYGVLHKDSDIYGNYISHIADNGIEAEGGNMNCRLYENYIAFGTALFSNAGTSMGPMYNFRNVCENNYRSSTQPTTGFMFKILGKTNGAGDNPGTAVHIGGGRSYLFHNTCKTGIDKPINNREMGLVNLVTRNNIFNMNGNPTATQTSYMSYYTPGLAMWSGSSMAGYLDFNYDMYRGSDWTTGQNPDGSARESNGISVATSPPQFETSPTYVSGLFSLAASSPGRNVAVALPNFNDLYTTPDMGAQERGQPAIVFGPR